MRSDKEKSVIPEGWWPARLFVGAAFVIFLIITGHLSSLQAGNTIQPEYSSRQDIRKQIKTLPYLHGYKPPPVESGVTVYDRKFAQPGVNLYVSGGSPPIVLMDMEGNILHTWKINEDYLGLKDPIFRRAHLFPTGDLLVLLEMNGMLKLDQNSNIIWFFRGLCHHDFDLAENGDIYVLTRKSKNDSRESPVTRSEERVKPTTMKSDDRKIFLEDMDIQGWIYDDCITILSPKGEKRKDISIFECFRDSEYRPMLQYMSLEAFQRNVFHTNTLDLIDSPPGQQSKPVQNGYALISPRNMHLIAAVDLIEEKVIWALNGMWTHQHQPELLPNGNIILFDNLGEKGNSKVIEFNPATQEVVWAYRGSSENGFRTEDLGSQQRLSNGNTLITESRDGRVFEVTPDNTIVWEFINPQRSTTNNNLIATIFEMIRINSINKNQVRKWKSAPIGSRDNGHLEK